MQRLDSHFDRKLLLLYAFPISPIKRSYHQILLTYRFRVENGKGSRNNLI